MIKALKTLCVIIGTIFFFALLLVMGLYNGDAIGIKAAIILGLISSAIMFGARLAHWIISDHQNNVDWLDYLKNDSRRC